MADKERIGKTFVGQRWIALNGNFTADELRLIAQNVEKAYKVAQNGNKK